MIKILTDEGKEVGTIFYYPNGEFGIKYLTKADDVRHIVWFVENPYEELTQILLISEILNNKQIKLSVDYLPFSREDKNNGGIEPLLLYFISMLEDKFNFTLSLDHWHSHSVSSKVNRSSMYSFINYINRYLKSEENIFVFPDETSYYRYGMHFKKEKFFVLNKERKNGIVSSIELSSDSSLNKSNLDLISGTYNLVLIDDICSYGNTFIKSVEFIKELTTKYVNFTIGIVQLFTYYDENQKKSKEFSNLINEHYFIKSINFNK